MSFLLEAKGKPREIQAWSWPLEAGSWLLGSPQSTSDEDEDGKGKAWVTINKEIPPNWKWGFGVTVGGHVGLGRGRPRCCSV